MAADITSIRVVAGVAINVRESPTHNRAGMEQTLAGIKAVAEKEG